MSTFKRRFIALVLVPLGLAGAAVVVADGIARGEAQPELIDEIQNIDAADLVFMEIIPGHDPYDVVPCLSTAEPDALNALTAFYARADDAYSGGDQPPLFRFRMRLRFIDGREAMYLIRRFERHPADVFLDRDIHELHGEGAFSRTEQPMIRIPGLVPWLRERQVYAGCPGD